MKKTIWIARVADDNSDAYTACYDQPSARAAAGNYFDHLTPGERRTHTVSVESYSVEAPDGDDRSAEILVRDLLAEDSEDLLNPDTWEEITK